MPPHQDDALRGCLFASLVTVATVVVLLMVDRVW